VKVKVIKGVYDSNTFIISVDGAVIIVDSGAALTDVKKAVRCRPVLAVLITHEHFDHLANCADYAKHFGTKIYCAREVADNLTYYHPILSADGTDYPIAQLSGEVQFSLIKAEHEFILGEINVKPYFMPGHSAGSVVYKIGNNIFTGDVLFAKGIGRTDMMTDGKKYMTETLNKLKALSFDTAYHGHGPESDYKTQQRNMTVFAKWLSR
jgi:glyoxylase-like metal-dependent hydrolase (beta-lactamase superfamily II)